MRAECIICNNLPNSGFATGIDHNNFPLLLIWICWSLAPSSPVALLHNSEELLSLADPTLTPPHCQQDRPVHQKETTCALFPSSLIHSINSLELFYSAPFGRLFFSSVNSSSSVAAVATAARRVRSSYVIDKTITDADDDEMGMKCNATEFSSNT